MADALFDGRKLRALAVVDNYSRGCLAIEVGQSLKGEDVVRVMNRLATERERPGTIKSDDGSEFISRVMDHWAYENNVELDFSRPEKPTDNAMVESFNGRLRKECLNEHWFLSLEDARHKIEAWRSYYNEHRPHSALEWAAPVEFARPGAGFFHCQSALKRGQGHWDTPRTAFRHQANQVVRPVQTTQHCSTFAG